MDHGSWFLTANGRVMGSLDLQDIKTLCYKIIAIKTVWDWEETEKETIAR